MNIFIALIFSVMSSASIANPKDVVQDIFARASSPEIASDSAMQTEINRLVDFDALANSALGRNAKSIPKAEQQWFRDTLREIITRTVYPKAPEFLKDVKISYDNVKESGGKATVSSSVQNKADLTDVLYQMRKSTDGSWKVVDVSISGLSWVESIQDQVRDVLKKKQWKGLKEAMNKKLAELKSGKSI